MMVPSSHRRPRRTRPRREAAPQVLAPGAGRGAEVDDDLPRPEQPQRLVDFLELVGRTCAVAVALRQLDVGVVEWSFSHALLIFLLLLLIFIDLPRRSIMQACPRSS